MTGVCWLRLNRPERRNAWTAARGPAMTEALLPNYPAYLLMATLLISRDHTRPLGRLTRHLTVHPTTVTLVIDQLAARELVIRRPHPTDRRTVLAALTDEGRRTVTRASEDLAAVQFGLSGVSESLAQRTTGVLRQIRAKMGDLA